MEQSLLPLAFLSWICLDVNDIIGKLYSADKIGAVTTWMQWAFTLSSFVTLGTAANHRLCTGTSQSFPSPTTEDNLLVYNNLGKSCGTWMSGNASILLSLPCAAGVTLFPTGFEMAGLRATVCFKGRAFFHLCLKCCFGKFAAVVQAKKDLSASNHCAFIFLLDFWRCCWDMEIRRHQSQQCAYGLAVTTIFIDLCWGGDVLHYGSGILLFSGTPLKDKGLTIGLQDLFLHLSLTCHAFCDMTVTILSILHLKVGL